MDDFYLPFARRRSNWREIPAGNMDLERFRREVLEPGLTGQPVLYRAYRCPEDRFLETEEIPWRPWAVVEGSYSQHPLLADAYRTKFFVTADPAVQEQRLRRREGDHFAAFREIWIPMEEHYFRTFAIERSADAVLLTEQIRKNDYMTHQALNYFNAKEDAELYSEVIDALKGKTDDPENEESELSEEPAAENTVSVNTEESLPDESGQDAAAEMISPDGAGGQESAADTGPDDQTVPAEPDVETPDSMSLI